MGKKVGIAEAQLEADKARAEYFQVAKQEEKAEQAELSNKHLANMAALDKACSIANHRIPHSRPKRQLTAGAQQAVGHEA